MNTYNRDIIVGLINKFHTQIRDQLELFFSKERDYQLKQDLFRNNWYLSDKQRKHQYKLEVMRIQLNTKKNLKNLTKYPVINRLEYITLLSILSNYLLFKYNKSEKSYSKFITKLNNNSIKTLNRKHFSKKQKIINRIVKNKLIEYKSSLIDVTLCNKIIKDIECVHFTTDKANKKRLEIINTIKEMIIRNVKIKIDIRLYINYLPDTVFNKLNILIN